MHEPAGRVGRRSAASVVNESPRGGGGDSLAPGRGSSIGNGERRSVGGARHGIEVGPPESGQFGAVGTGV